MARARQSTRRAGAASAAPAFTAWVRLREDERLAADVAELALTASSPALIWHETMELLARVVGFDAGYVATTSGDPRDAQGALIGYQETFLRTQIGRYLQEFSGPEVAAYTNRARRHDEVWGQSRRGELAVFRDVLHPAGTRALLVRASCRQERLLGINLERRDSALPFDDRALALVDTIAPVIHLVDVLARSPSQGGAHFDAWAESHRLTARERQVAALVLRGLRNAEVAQILGMSPFTVRNTLVNVFEKADVTTRAELVFLASSPAELLPAPRAIGAPGAEGLRCFVDRVRAADAVRAAVTAVRPASPPRRSGRAKIVYAAPER